MSDTIKQAVLSKISNYGAVSHRRHGLFDVGGTLVHVRYRSGTKKDGKTISYNINNTTLQGVYELWIWGDGENYYLIPNAEIRDIYNTPTRWTDYRDGTRCVAEVDTTNHVCRYNTEGVTKDFRAHFNACLPGTAATIDDICPPNAIPGPISLYGEFGGCGEGEPHRQLKDYLAENPSALGLGYLTLIGKEFKLLSGDGVDILFESDSGELIAVEVKSSFSAEGDVRRGLFQCIKYASVISAMQKVDKRAPLVRAILALGASLPKSLGEQRDILGIQVVENLRATKLSR